MTGLSPQAFGETWITGSARVTTGIYRSKCAVTCGNLRGPDVRNLVPPGQQRSPHDMGEDVQVHW
jgi:hypothetical protein